MLETAVCWQLSRTNSQSGATSGVGVLATYNYGTSSNASQLGVATGFTFGNGASTSYAYDAVQRLTTLGHDITGTTYDQSLGFSYNPAGQITQNTRSNDLYAWNGHYNVNRNYTANGLNQYTASGSVTPTFDTKGNLTSAGSTTYAYSSENLLKTASGGITLSYDPAMRLYETAGGSPGTVRRQYDGVDLVAEYNGSGVVLRRFVHGARADVPLVWYEGSGLTTRRFLQSDERGSVTAVTDGSNTIVGTNTYDEYGIPGSGNLGRFQYTGQTWLPELGMYYYKARVYSPTLGRFLQTDPIGYGDGMNSYAYLGADPVNKADPTGTHASPSNMTEELEQFAGSGRVWDWMGMGARAAGGRLEAASYEQQQSTLAWVMMRFQQISNQTGISVGCLMSASCTGVAVFLAGIESGLAQAGLGTAKNWINTPPQFFAHVAAGHFGADDRFSSKFALKYQNTTSLISLASFAANSAAMRPGDFPGTFVYTARYTGLVGFLMGTGQPTNYVTLVVKSMGTFHKGLPEYQAITMYPGF